MSRKYFSGIMYPVINYLREKGSVDFDTLKSYYTNGVSDGMLEVREKKFNEWLKELEDSHVITIEYGTVTFNEEQWERALSQANETE